jgi:8-amino-7-oxononanoate synthase
MKTNVQAPSLRGNLRVQLDCLHASHHYRRRRVLDSPQGSRIQLNGKSLLNFCSNDYLGLANDPRVVAAFKRGCDKYGVGSGASHLVCGHSTAHEDLEIALAEFTGRERALLFANGYSANMAVIRALVNSGDCVFQDRLNHASLLDGGWISRAEVSWFEHRHYTQLQQGLEQTSAQQKLIVSDGVFSMDGDCCDVAALVNLAKSYQAWLMIDDAHGFGVLGDKGQGLVGPDIFSQDDVPILVGTLGKAFGTSGAFVAGSEELIEWLIQKARNYIFSTSMPSAIAVASVESLNIVQTESWRRQHLQTLIAQFIEGAQRLGLPLLPSLTPIQPVLLHDSATCLKVSQQLEQVGVFASAIRPPTVPDNSARIRITFSAVHSFADVNILLNAFAKIIHG